MRDELFKDLLTSKIGLSEEEAIKFFEGDEVDSDILSKFKANTGNLITKEFAIQDQDLRKQVMRTTLNGVDNNLLERLKDLGLNEVELASVNGEDKTSAKIAKGMQILSQRYENQLIKLKEAAGDKKSLIQDAENWRKEAADKDLSIAELQLKLTELEQSRQEDIKKNVLLMHLNQLTYLYDEPGYKEFAQQRILLNILNEVDLDITDFHSPQPLAKGLDGQPYYFKTRPNQPASFQDIINHFAKDYLAKTKPSPAAQQKTLKIDPSKVSDKMLERHRMNLEGSV